MSELKKNISVTFPIAMEGQAGAVKYQVEVEDCFIWQGLKMAPPWVADLVLDEQATVFPGKKTLMIKYRNGYAFADRGDLIIRRSPVEYEVIRRVMTVE